MSVDVVMGINGDAREADVSFMRLWQLHYFNQGGGRLDKCWL